MKQAEAVAFLFFSRREAHHAPLLRWRVSAPVCARPARWKQNPADAVQDRPCQPRYVRDMRQESSGLQHDHGKELADHPCRFACRPLEKVFLSNSFFATFEERRTAEERLPPGASVVERQHTDSAGAQQTHHFSESGTMFQDVVQRGLAHHDIGCEAVGPDLRFSIRTAKLLCVCTCTTPRNAGLSTERRI
jgi:hypothetical protein